MAKPLIFRHGGRDLPFAYEKVDRSKLYGYIDTEAIADDGRRCELATLLPDGHTIVAKGGRAIAFLSQEGEWLEKGRLKPVDPEGKPVTPVPSSFAAPIELLTKSSIDEYLTHNIKSTYVMDCEEDAGALVAELKAGTIYSFPYSFRGGLVADVGFLLCGQDGNVFLMVGQPTRMHFIGLDQMVGYTEDEPEAGDDDDADLDFGMM